MEAGLRSIFWIGAVTMLLAFLIISTIPATTVRTGQEEEKLLNRGEFEKHKPAHKYGRTFAFGYAMFQRWSIA